MYLRLKQFFFYLFAIALLWIFKVPLQASTGTNTNELFADRNLDTSLIGPVPDIINTKRRYFKAVNESIHKNLRSKKQIDFKVRDGLIIKTSQIEIIEHDLLRYTWKGKVLGDDLGLVTITVGKDRSLYVNIYAFGTYYRLVPIKNQVWIHQLLEIESLMSAQGEQDSIPVSATDLIRAQSVQAVLSDRPSASTATDGTVIDVMVVYSSAANDASTDIRAQINSEITWTNAVLEQSCTQTSLRLVHIERLSEAESGDSTTDLNRLRTSDDGYFDNIHTLRATYGADLVQMWASTGSSGTCGLAYAPVIPAASFGFSWKRLDCDASTTAHEFAHNMGAVHDPYQENTSGVVYGDYLAGHGHVDIGAKLRTIMGYNTECARYGESCQRIPYFSNPKIVYNGVALGVANISDVSQVIRNNRESIANFQAAVSTPEAVNFNNCQQVGSSDNQKLDLCVMATAAYGSPVSDELVVLRTFRDQYLIHWPLGTDLVHLYYYWGQKLVPFIKKYKVLKIFVKFLVQFLIFLIQETMISLGILLLLLFLLRKGLMRFN